MTHEDPHRSYPEHRDGPEHDHSLPDATSIPEFTDVELSMASPMINQQGELTGAAPGWWDEGIVAYPHWAGTEPNEV